MFIVALKFNTTPRKIMCVISHHQNTVHKLAPQANLQLLSTESPSLLSVAQALDSIPWITGQLCSWTDAFCWSDNIVGLD